MLDKIEEIVNNTPAVENSASRFGNPAFRTFYDKVSEARLSEQIIFRAYTQDIRAVGTIITWHITKPVKGYHPGNICLLHRSVG